MIIAPIYWVRSETRDAKPSESRIRRIKRKTRIQNRLNLRKHLSQSNNMGEKLPLQVW